MHWNDSILLQHLWLNTGECKDKWHHFRQHTALLKELSSKSMLVDLRLLSPSGLLSCKIKWLHSVCSCMVDGDTCGSILLQSKSQLFILATLCLTVEYRAIEFGFTNRPLSLSPSLSKPMKSICRLPHSAHIWRNKWNHERADCPNHCGTEIVWNVWHYVNLCKSMCI